MNKTRTFFIQFLFVDAHEIKWSEVEYKKKDSERKTFKRNVFIPIKAICCINLTITFDLRVFLSLPFFFEKYHLHIFFLSSSSIRWLFSQKWEKNTKLDKIAYWIIKKNPILTRITLIEFENATAFISAGYFVASHKINIEIFIKSATVKIL